MSDRLELGSGYHPTPDFMTLDANPATYSDFLGLAFPLPETVFLHVEAKGRFTELRAVDVLEHISYRDTVRALREWRSIVDYGAKLYVQVPDAERIMEWWYEAVHASGSDRITARVPADLPQTPLMGATWRLLGGHADGEHIQGGDDWRLNAHYALFDAEHLTDVLNRSGWEVERIVTNAHPNLCAWAVAT